jgi:hypothetical protein
LTIETSYPPTRWPLALGAPRIIIDGQPVLQAKWGRIVVPVALGVHTVQISSSSLGTPKQVTVDTRYGPQAVYYAASWMWFGGSIGSQPVSSPGGGARIAWTVAPTIVVLLCLFGCLAALFFGLCGGAFIPRH